MQKKFEKLRLSQIIRDQDILEYSELVERMMDSRDGDASDAAMAYPAFFDAYLSSRRRIREDKLEQRIQELNQHIRKYEQERREFEQEKRKFEQERREFEQEKRKFEQERRKFNQESEEKGSQP